MTLRALVMFAAILGIRPNAESGSQPTEAKAPQPKRRTRQQHRNKPSTVDSKLEQGERCWNFLKDTWGEERAEAYRCAVLYQAGIQTDAGSQPTADASSGSQPTPLHPKLPYTFWNSHMPTVLALRKNKSKHMECMRALKFFIERSGTGARTMVALRFGRKKGVVSKR